MQSQRPTWREGILLLNYELVTARAGLEPARQLSTKLTVSPAANYGLPSIMELEGNAPSFSGCRADVILLYQSPLVSVARFERAATIFQLSWSDHWRTRRYIAEAGRVERPHRFRFQIFQESILRHIGASIF